MALADYALAIGGLTLGPNTNYIIHSITGFGAPIGRTADAVRPRWHGETPGSDYLEGRTITIDMTIRGSSSADAVANLDALLAVWQPITTPATTVPLSYKFPGQAEREFHGRPRRIDAATDRIITNSIPVVLEYRATDPLQYATTITSNSVGLITASTGRTYPRTYNLSYGGGTTASLTMTNSGTFATRPTFRITGPALNPVIENVTTGESLSFSIDIAASDYLDIDTDARTVLLNGTASRYSTLSTGSTFFDLNPGATQLRFRADTYNATATLTCTFQSAWL